MVLICMKTIIIVKTFTKLLHQYTTEKKGIEMSHHHIKGTLNFKSVTSINFTDEYYIGVDLICAVVFRIFRLQLTTING